MVDGYEFDLFLSYRRQPPVLDWMKNHFGPMLEQWFPHYMPHKEPPRIFIDEKIETGTDWPFELRNALSRSRLLLPVFSPDYFSSPWCMAELETMLERERLLGLRSPSDPRGLIFPVTFSDGEHFPEPINRIQRRDLRKWNVPYPFFSQTAGIIELLEEVKKFLPVLAARIKDAPLWQPGWPVRPEPSIEETVVKFPFIR